MARPVRAEIFTSKRAVFVPPPLPSFTVAFPIDTVGAGSSLKIVHDAVALAMIAFTGPLNVRLNTSLVSQSVSPRSPNETIWLVEPGGKVREPLRNTKSTLAVAVPLDTE